MKNLTALLERFNKRLNKDRITKGVITETILHATGVNLSPEAISLKEGILTVSATATIKNEIKLKEEGIRREFKERGVPISRIIYT